MPADWSTGKLRSRGGREYKPKNPVINTRSFGEDPIQVADKVIAYASGLEGGGCYLCANTFPDTG